MLDDIVEQPILRTESLTKQVNTGEAQLTILQDINLQVEAGEAVAIIGASGSGKSTLLGLLAGLDLPTSGKVHLDNIDKPNRMIRLTLNEFSYDHLRGTDINTVTLF